MVGGQGGTVEGALPVTVSKSRRYLVTTVIEAHGNWGPDFEQVVKEELTHQIGRITGGRIGQVKLQVIHMLIVPGGTDPKEGDEHE